jgi:hypothetical protein
VGIAVAIVAFSLRTGAGETGIRVSDNVLVATAYFSLTLAILLGLDRSRPLWSSSLGAGRRGAPVARRPGDGGHLSLKRSDSCFCPHSVSVRTDQS